MFNRLSQLPHFLQSWVVYRWAAIGLALFLVLGLPGAAVNATVPAADATAVPANKLANSAALPVGLYVTLAKVDPYTQQAELTASDGAMNDQFGTSVALSADGRTALVGMPGKTVGGHAGQGAVSVFTASGATWTQGAELAASSGAANDLFGFSVALSSDGSAALVSAPGSSGLQGAAYIFTASGSRWTQQAELIASDGTANDLFGSSVALSSDGRTALVGAPFFGTGSHLMQGTAYVYTASGATWTQGDELTITGDDAANAKFGHSVALSGDGHTALIAAPGKKVGGEELGAAYVFTANGATWTQGDELTASDGFGSSVALSANGRTALVGASQQTVGNNDMQGAAYVYTASGATWTQGGKLTASDGAAKDGFGGSVALSADGSTALVGAYVYVAGLGTRSKPSVAYLFTASGTTWTQGNELTASDGTANDAFGYSLALSADSSTALVGAPLKTVGSNKSQGAAYVFGAPMPAANG